MPKDALRLPFLVSNTVPLVPYCKPKSAPLIPTNPEPALRLIDTLLPTATISLPTLAKPKTPPVMSTKFRTLAVKPVTSTAVVSVAMSAVKVYVAVPTVSASSLAMLVPASV